MASEAAWLNMQEVKSFVSSKIKSSHLWNGFCFSLIGAHILTGVFGRDPWKADEPYSFGIALNFLLGHHWRDWIVPYVGAEPFVEKPPLIYWTAALFAKWTDTLLPLQAGLQLAILVWLALTLVALFSAARQMYAGQYGLRACMLLLGTIGTLGHTQKLIADLSQYAGTVLALTALVRFITAPKNSSLVPAGFLLGTGAGIAFMSKGVLVPGVLALTSIISIITLPTFRSRRAVTFFTASALAALPWLLIWPILFWRTSEPLFIEWLRDNNFGRFLGFSAMAETRPNYWAEIGLAFVLSFPAGWLAAVHTITRWRMRLSAEPARILLWIYTAVFLGAVLFMSASFREVYLLSAYPALALLGASVHLPEKIDQRCKIISIMLFSALGASLWLCWVALLSGYGQMLPLWINRWLPLSYTLHWNTVWLLAGLALSGLWLCAILCRARLDAITLGFAGLTLVWGLLHTLLLPWLNEARSYRTSFNQLNAVLPTRYNCLAVINVGESEQAMLHYFIGIRPVQKKIPGRIPCQALLVLDKKGEQIPTLSRNRWREVWRGGRMGDDNERFRAYLQRVHKSDVNAR